MNRQPHAHLPAQPSRLREAVDMVLFLLLVGGIVIALCAVDPGVAR